MYNHVVEQREMLEPMRDAAVRPVSSSYAQALGTAFSDNRQRQIYHFSS
jgi:hypothetical protein